MSPRILRPPQTMEARKVQDYIDRLPNRQVRMLRHRKAPDLRFVAWPCILTAIATVAAIILFAGV